jgi:hypothetical protein
VPWRFSDACRQCLRIGLSCRHLKTCTTPGIHAVRDCLPRARAVLQPRRHRAEFCVQSPLGPRPGFGVRETPFYASFSLVHRSRLLFYSITSSARARTAEGCPQSVPVFRSIARLISRFAGLAPLRIFSTYDAARHTFTSRSRLKRQQHRPTLVQRSAYCRRPFHVFDASK